MSQHQQGNGHGGGHGQSHGRDGRVLVTSLAALGVVYGDIGTSPLYAMRESFESHHHEIEVLSDNIIGVLSLILWSLIVIVTIKYLAYVMKADNHGEGGILALTALILPEGGNGNGNSSATGGSRYLLIALGLFGTALLYGDGMITPAISVLSAIEGTKVATSSLENWVVPISCVILVGLFAVQKRGTAKIGAVFGPIMVVWFTTLGIMGLVHLVDEPGVLRSVNPYYGLRFFADNGFQGFLALGSVFLVVTGGEALYADMGHFGRRPIQLGWYSIVLPGLMLHYFGQGAMLLQHPERIENPFYRMVPEELVIPLVVLATAASVIASQALISGVYSLTLQAVRLGYLPRMRITHTSESEMGQIYIPSVNWILMVACLGLVIGFRSSSNLASAYGVAVTLTMVVTSILYFQVLRERFSWATPAASALCGMFLVIEFGFFGANAFKIPDGGWFPLVVGVVLFTVMTTWRSGRLLLADRLHRGEVPLDRFVASLEAPRTQRVRDTAVYLFPEVGATPPSLLTNCRANNVIHEQVLVVSVATDPVPRVLPARRSTVKDLGKGFHQVVLHYGFMETPDIPRGLRQGAAVDLAVPATATYFLGAETLRVTDRPGMAKWREHLFSFMARNSTPAATYFGLPDDRTVSIGQQVEL
jgi:KUP system potassium uptake protein